jgi:rhomboid protease GluP
MAQPGIPVTLGLIGVNVSLFVVMLFFGAGLWHTSSDVQLFWGANFGPATKDGQWWRLGSAMFLHFGVVHLAMNMLALWDVGRLVERLYGSVRFAAIYFLAGLGGNLLSLVVRGEHAVSGGASGAIFGIYGALLVSLWWERRYLQPREFRWMFWGGACFSIAIIAVGQILPMIDNAAHVGGFCTGVMLGMILLRPLQSETDIPKTLRWGATALLLASTAFLVTKIPAPRYLWSEEINARSEINAYLREDATISNTWQSLLARGGEAGHLSFSQLAGELEANVADRYEESFDQIAQVHVDAAAPSAATLATLRRYAELRRDSSRTMVEGLRTRDREKINAAIDLAEKSRKVIRPDGARSETSTGQGSAVSEKK